jgi:hypothetical protein
MDIVFPFGQDLDRRLTLGRIGFLKFSQDAVRHGMKLLKYLFRVTWLR